MRRGLAALAVLALGVGLLLVHCKNLVPHPPDKPAAPSGPTTGGPGVSYIFSASATDPDGDSVRVMFDWGDGTQSFWAIPVASGDSVFYPHTWDSAGAFSVTVKAKDAGGLESDWSEALAVAVGAAEGWERTYGRPGVSEVAFSVVSSPEGGCAVVGLLMDTLAQEFRAMLLMLNDQGDSLWSSLSSSNAAMGWGAAPGPAGDYVVVGGLVPNPPGSFEACLWTMNEQGQTHEVLYGVQGLLTSARRTTDGGYILAGREGVYPDEDLLLIRTDQNGNAVWTKVLGGPDMDAAYDAVECDDGGFLCVGSRSQDVAFSNGIYLLKLSSSGDSLWARVLCASDNGSGWSLETTTDGGFVVCGGIGPDDSDVLLLKVNADGNELWRHNYGGEDAEYGSRVRRTSDGGYVLAAYTESYGAGSSDAWLVRTDAGGNELWTRTFGTSGTEVATDVLQTYDGGFVLVGRQGENTATDSDIYVVRTDASGRVGGGR